MKKGNIGLRICAALIDDLAVGTVCLIFFWNWVVYWLMYPVLMFLYYALFEGMLSATPGKLACRLMVVDENGNKLDTGKGFLRSVCRLLSCVTAGVGFFIGLFNDDYITLHDKLAKTFVIDARTYAGIQSTAGGKHKPMILATMGYFAGQSFVVAPQGCTFGRDAECEFVFPEGTQGISRNHCKLVYNAQTGMFVLSDLGSTYGTFTGSGIRVMPGQPVAMTSGEEFYLATRANTFRVTY